MKEINLSKEKQIEVITSLPKVMVISNIHVTKKCAILLVCPEDYDRIYKIHEKKEATVEPL